MRISDWSSDVCSSDLHTVPGFFMLAGLERAHVVAFAHFPAIVAQQRIGRGDMEEELRQNIGQQVVLAGEAFFLRRDRTGEIGKASGREIVYQDVLISVGPVLCKKTKRI